MALGFSSSSGASCPNHCSWLLPNPLPPPCFQKKGSSFVTRALGAPSLHACVTLNAEALPSCFWLICLEASVWMAASHHQSCFCSNQKYSLINLSDSHPTRRASRSAMLIQRDRSSVQAFVTSNELLAESHSWSAIKTETQNVAAGSRLCQAGEGGSAAELARSPHPEPCALSTMMDMHGKEGGFMGAVGTWGLLPTT